MARDLILAIDQGTTSSRALVFDPDGQVTASANREFTQYFPHDGWVEHDPEEIWQTTLDVCRQVLADVKARDGRVRAIGITNQRETTLLWDRRTGKCLHRAIVWQDRRTAATCEQLKQAGHEPAIQSKTGLLLDPYFSGTKLAWLLDHVEGAREAAARGELAFGTVDTFLLWRLTSGKHHLTDATNASRTLMLDISRAAWDDELLELLRVPPEVLPEVRDSADDFGVTDAEVLGEQIPIRALIGDQQAALVGQACLQPGFAKSTYGTGCFLVVNVGDEIVKSPYRLLSTIGYQLDGKTTYAIEGSIFNAGSAVQWLRDSLRAISSAEESEAIAASLDGNHGVYLVPAFTGLGAPHWDAHARGGIFGLTRDAGLKEIVRATLESVAYQTYDLVSSMDADGNGLRELRVDGGMARNTWFVQFLADILGVEVHRASVTEATGWGAAALAAVSVKLLPSVDAIAERWRCDQVFTPRMTEAARSELIQGWNQAVARVSSTRADS